MNRSSAKASKSKAASRHLNWTAGHTGLLASACVAAFLLLADPGIADAWIVVTLTLAVGLTVGASLALRLTALAACMAVGIVVGLASSIVFLPLTAPEKSLAVAATIATYAALGFIVGVFVEFVRFLHRITHSDGHRR